MDYFPPCSSATDYAVYPCKSNCLQYEECVFRWCLLLGFASPIRFLLFARQTVLITMQPNRGLESIHSRIMRCRAVLMRMVWFFRFSSFMLLFCRSRCLTREISCFDNYTHPECIAVCVSPLFHLVCVWKWPHQRTLRFLPDFARLRALFVSKPGFPLFLLSVRPAGQIPPIFLSLYLSRLLTHRSLNVHYRAAARTACFARILVTTTCISLVQRRAQSSCTWFRHMTASLLSFWSVLQRTAK